MRTDLYTKAVLTVIAVTLAYIAATLTPIGTPLQAQSETINATGTTRVVLVGWEGRDGKTYPINDNFGLPVTTGNTNLGRGLDPRTKR